MPGLCICLYIFFLKQMSLSELKKKKLEAAMFVWSEYFSVNVKQELFIQTPPSSLKASTCNAAILMLFYFCIYSVIYLCVCCVMSVWIVCCVLLLQEIVYDDELFLFSGTSTGIRWASRMRPLPIQVMHKARLWWTWAFRGLSWGWGGRWAIKALASKVRP